MPIRSALSAGRRKLLVLAAAFLLAAIVGGAFAPAPTEATTRCGTEFLYFSDASHTELVGVWGWLPMSCSCQSYQWGTFSAHRVVQDSWC